MVLHGLCRSASLRSGQKPYFTERVVGLAMKVHPQLLWCNVWEQYIQPDSTAPHPWPRAHFEPGQQHKQSLAAKLAREQWAVVLLTVRHAERCRLACAKQVSPQGLPATRNQRGRNRQTAASNLLTPKLVRKNSAVLLMAVRSPPGTSTPIVMRASRHLQEDTHSCSWPGQLERSSLPRVRIAEQQIPCRCLSPRRQHDFRQQAHSAQQRPCR